MRFAALSDVGRVRPDNQDSGYAGPHLLAVADGVGGAARGDVASSATIAQLRTLDQQPGDDAIDRLVGGVDLAHSRIADLVAENPELDGTSTTADVVLFDGDRFHLAHVGDSRGYLLRSGELRMLTKDHTFVQSLVDEGRITDEEAKIHPHRSVILRAVDGVHEPEPDTSSFEAELGDRIMLCSDGCSGVLDDHQLAELLGTDTIERAAGALVSAALEAGSNDNVTVVIGEIVEQADTGAGVPPLTVGAAAGEGRPNTSWIMRRRREEPAPSDPEALRYAPLPPRRFLAVRRVLTVLALLVLVAALGFGGYQWTQTRYYVGAHDGRVSIYRGVDWKVPLLTLNHVVDVSKLKVAELNQNDESQVRDGIPAESHSDAVAKVAALRQRACPPTTNKPSTKPSSTPSPKAKSSKRSARRSHSASASPSAHASSTVPADCEVG